MNGADLPVFLLEVNGATILPAKSDSEVVFC